MSKSRAITENFTRMVNSERWKTLSVEQQSKYKQEYDEMLDRALAEEQQTATPTTADTGSATEAQPPKSRQIAQNFNRMRETDRWKTGLTDEQRENYTEEAKALHRRALVEEGSGQTPDTKLNIQQEVWQPYMPPEEEKRMADPTVGTVGKALGKSLLRAPGNLASTIVGAGGVIADLAGKGLKNIPYLEGVGSKISEVGQDTINVSNTMDAWNKHYIPPEQTAPQNLEEFGDMTWGQKGVFLADQLPEQVATMFLPGMMGAKFGQAAVAGAKGAKAAGVLKPLTGYLTSKGPKAAQALGALTGSTIQSAAEIGKSQMQEAGDTDALATMIAAPLAGKLESLVPASAEWLSGSFKGASRKAFSEAMKSPVTFLAHVSKEMLKNSTTESVTELMQESIQKYATERAKGERGQGVLDAAAKASNILREKGIDGLIAEAKKNETVGQLAMAAILGGVAGGVFEGTGRSFAGAKYLTSPVRRYDAMVNAQTDEEKKVAAEAWKKLTPLQMQKAREEAAFRTIFELDDDESDPETVKDNFNVLRELGADGYAVAAQSAAANGWTPSESYQTRMTEFLTENPEFATELEKISGAQAVKTAPKITQEKPYVNLEPKSNISGQNAPAKPQPNVVDLINQIAGGQGDEYDSYAQSLANAQEPDPETKRASAVGGDLETAPGIINAKDYQESPDELTRLFPPEDMFSTGKTEQGEVAGREIPGKGFAGKKTKIRAGDITTDGEYAIVELDSLQRNKQMGELQNRDRTREASQAQIESIAANPDPDMLISSDVFANDGPMVVGPDFVVESGNGRTEGLNLAYQKGSAGKYTQALVQRAAEFGLDPQAISRMKKPVLVRIRTGEVAGNDRSAFVSAANAPRQLQRSATEKAITDGQAILDFVGNLETTGSNINTAANRPFLAEFFNRVATPEERGALFTATGELSQDGLNRVRNAVFSAAYGSPDLLVNLTEDTDSEIKSIINGLLEAAPDTAALSGEAKRGGVHPVSLTSALADAAKKIAGLRQQGQKVEAYFQQGQFGDDKLSPEARMLLGLFSDLGSSKKINDFVRAFNQTVRAYGSPSQMQIPGMESEPPTIREVMTQAIRKTTPELESKIERWVQGPPSLGVEFSRKGQKPVDAGNQKLLDLLERIGQNADPETAQASSKLVNLINSIGDKAPEYMAEGKPAGEKNRDQVKYFSQPKDPGTQAGVISREELENTARTIQANLEPTTGVKVVVLETTDELTEIIQEANPAADPVPSDVEGALFNNTAYLVRNNLPDAKRATEVAGHEIIGHFGLQAILGREFTSQLVELEKLAETDQQVKAELDRAEKDYFDEDESAAKNRRIALEEALARISEKYAADPDTFGGKVRAWFEQSIGKIRDALRVLGFDIKFTASDLANTIRSSKAAVTRDGSFNSASKGAALDSYEKLAEVDRQFEESGMGEIWRFAKKTASQTLNKEKFRRKLYKNPLWEFLTPEKQQELLENTELYKGGLERRLRQMQNKKIRTRQHKGTSISDMLINKYPETPYAPFMPDSGKASVEAFEIAKEIISNDPTAKAFRGQLDVKNLKTLNDASESETDANNRFLKNFAEYFKEAVDSISNNNLLVKYGGDEWDSFIVVSKEVTEEDVRRYLMVAHKKAVQHAISMGIKETAENPRAPQPRGLGESLAANYKSGYVTPGIEKLVDDYAKDLWKYLTGRGMGFRIGISEVKLDQSFNESAEEISKQHKAEKEGKSLDQKTAEEYRQIIDGNIARIRRGETPIRFSIKKRMAGDVSEGKGSLQEVLVEQRRPGRPGGESGEIRVPGDEGILPSRLEQLIEQIGAELPPQHKETGNKLLDILSSLGDDTVSDDPQFSIKTGSLGKPGFQPMRPVMAGDRNFNRAYGIEPGRGHVYDDANSDEPTVINRTGSSWRTRYQNPGAAAWVRQEELKENARFREEQRQGYGKFEELLEALPEKDISRQAKSKIEEILEALPDESPKYSYAGQKAKRPRGTTGWKTAKAMLEAGKDPEAVRLETGWFVSPYDQKPRFEIDDSKVELNEQLWQHPALKGRTTFELAGVINHPELFAAYPALKDIMTTIEIDPDKQESGSYLPGTPGDEYTYGREPEIQIVAPNYESAKNSLIHEIQHAIQEIEGFAKGGSPREFLQAEKDKLDMIMERISILNKEMENAVGTPRYKELMDARNELSQQVVEIQKEWDSRGGAYGAAFNKYQSLAGEIEARDSADRTELSREERKLYPPYSTAEYGPDEAIVRFSKAGRALRGSVQNVLDRYNDGDPDVATEEDLINEVEALLEDSDAASEPDVAKLLSSIEKYRSEAEDDRLKYGMRGDVDAYTDEAMTSIRQFVEAGDAKFSRSNRANQPTLEFKKWFGNSKIVDDQGRPMVVYHGTNKKFNVFAVEKDGLPNDAAMFFSGSKKVAEDFAGMRFDATKGKPRVVEAYLNINNPAQIGNIDDLVTIDQLWKRAGLDVRTIPEGLADLQGGAKMPVWQWYAEEPAVWRAIEDAGFDGAVGTERGEPLYVAFSPTQAKSATDNRGTFDPENPDIRFSKQGEADPGFRTYSEMERTLTKPGMLPKKASKTDMVSAIQKHVGKFKKVELDESGLIDHIQNMQADQVTSQDVADYLDMNRIELEEKDSARWRINTADDTAQKYFDTEEEAKAAIEAERKWVENDAVTVDIGDNLITVVDQIDGTIFAAQGDERGLWFDRYGVLHHASKDEAIAMAESKAEKRRDYYRNLISAEPEFDESRTQYEKYQVRGGKKYRELLLTLPSAGTRRTGGSADVAGFGVVEFADNEIPMFQSLHWGEPNVLLHVRFNEREDADGNKVLFVEEIQSDWHQAGRKKGYRKPGMQKRIEELEAEIQEIQAKGREATQEDKQRWADLKNEHQNLVRTMTKGAPEAPMKQTDRWAMLGMKRMIQWAADNGFDKVAWAPGDEQAKRYDLSKQISEIIFEDNQSGGIGLARLDGPATNGQLIAFDKNKRLVINQHIQPEQLEDYIGKDAAKKLLEQQPQRTQSAGIGVRQRKLGGVNLKVGGEGMKAFYDGILKNETAKYIKKWGAKVGAVELPIKDDGFVSGNDVMDEMNIPPGERQSYWANLASDEREELMNKYRSRRATAHGFDITPAMRQGVAAGQPLYSKKGGDLADQLDPNPEPAPTLTEESKSQATKVFGAIRQVASGLMGKTVSQRDRENPAFKRSQTLNPEADTDFELERKNKIDAATKARAFEDKTILDHLDADKNLITGMIRKLTPKGDLQDWLLKKAARVLAPYQAAKPIERILFTVGENIAWDGKKIVASPGIRSYNPETGEYEYKPSEHAAAAMHFFNMLSPEWQELMTERAKANEEYRQNFVNVVIPHRKAQTAIALLARYRQMGADRTALEGAEAEARSMLKALDGKIDQAEHNELKSLLEEVVSIPADRINKMVVRMESIIKQATGELKTPAQLQRALKSLNTNRGHYGYVHHFFESDRVPSQGKAFDAFGRVPNGWIEDVPGTQKIRTGAEGNKRNLLEADIAKEAKEAKAEAANNWMRDIEDQRGLLVEEFEDIPDDQMPEGYVGYENERPFRRRVFANFGKYRGQEIYLPVKTFDSYKLVKEKGVDDPSMKEFGETIAMLDGVANRMNEAMLYHTGKFARDLLSAPFHIIEFVRDWSFTSPTEIPFVIKALTKAIASQASAKTWQKSTPESHGEYSESLPYQNKSDKKSFLTRAGDAIGRLITKDLPVGSTVAAMLKEINLSGAADLPLKRIFESVGEQLAERRGLKGKARERFVYDMINQYAFVTQDLPPWLAWLRGQMPSKESRGAGAIMRLTIPFLGYSSRLAKQMLADPVSKGLLPMAKRLIGKKDADANFLREFSEASRPFFWLFFKSLVASGLGGLLPPEEEGIASDIQDAENLNPLARTHGRILWSQDDDPKGGENWLSVKGLGHLQVADALSDVVAGKSSVSDLSTEFLTIHPAMSWILGSVGVENPYDAKVPKGARAGRMLAQALVPQLTRYGPEMGKFFRAAAGNNTIPDAQKQSFFTAFFEQLGIPAGEVKVDRDGKLRTTRTALELLKQVGVNMRHIPYDMIAEAVDSELGSAKYYTDRLEMIQEYRDGDRDTDLSEREFIAQTLQTNKWTKIDDAERDMTKALVDRGQGALATLAKLRQKGVPVNAKPPKKKKDKGFGGSFGGKKFGGGFGSSFKKSPESKREEKVSDLEKKIQEIQSNQPKPKSWHDQLLDVIKSI